MSTHIGRITSTAWVRIALALVITFASVLFIQTVYGQSENPITSVVPTVSTQNVRIDSSSATSVTGSFDAYNTESRHVGNLTYSYIILGPRPAFDGTTLSLDDAPMYAEIPSNADFSLAPGEKKNIPFTLEDLPNLPRGEYRVRIEIRTQEGRVSSWADATTVLGEEILGFGVFEGGFVAVDSTDPFSGNTRSEWEPYEGVNVDAGQEMTFELSVGNAGSATLDGTIRMNTTKLLTPDSSNTTTSGPTVSIEPAQSVEVSLPFTAASEPGSYETEITIVNAEGTVVSSASIFRTVVRGASASILRSTLDTPATKAGETVKASLSIVGPADRETSVDGSVEVEVLSGQIVVGKESLDVPLTDTPTVASAAVKLESDVTETLGLRITVKDGDGQVLATSTSSFPEVVVATPTETTQPSTPISTIAIRVAIGATVVVLLLIIILAIRARGNREEDTLSPPPGTTGTLLLIAGVVVSGLLLFGGLNLTAQAQNDPWGIFLSLFGGSDGEDGRYVETRNATGISIIQVTKCGVFGAGTDCGIDNHRLLTNITPLQDAAYGSEIVYDIRLEWYACANKGQAGEVIVKSLQGGGTQVDSIEQANSSTWDTLASLGARGRDLEKTPGEYATFWLSVFGTVTYPGPFPNDTTTIWTDAHSNNGNVREYDHDDFRWITFGATEETGSDVSITKQGSNGAVLGGLANYTLKVESNGPESATDITVTDAIPTGLTFNSQASSPACGQVGTNVVCTLSSLAPNATSLLAVTFNVPADGSLSCGDTVSNVASIESESSDPNTSNNTSSTIQTSVQCGACADGEDNDGDGLTDEEDPACHDGYDLNQPYNPSRPSENDTQCTDGEDNDGDGDVDEDDPGCHAGNDPSAAYVPADNDESNVPVFDPGVITEED